MKKQSWKSGGKGLALAGSVVAAVLVLLGLAFSVRVAPPDRPAEEQAAIAPPAPEAQSAPQTEAQTADQPETGAEEAADAVDAPASGQVTSTEADPVAVDALPETATVATADADATDATDADAVLPEVVAKTDEAPQATPETVSELTTMAATGPDQDVSDTAPIADNDTPTEAAPIEAENAPAVAETPAQDHREVLPSFDTVRLAPDGEAVVAGRADPGSSVDILLDGVVVGTATTGADGAFAAFLSLPPSAVPRVLTLTISRDGAVVASNQQVIIAPVQRPSIDVAAQSSAPDATIPQPAPEAVIASPQTAAAPALLLSDGNGLSVLQPATPADPTQVSGVAIDVISYTSEGDVLLQGRATAAANILIYMDNAAVTSAQVGEDGIWSTGLPGVSPGIYTLRLDEVDAAGKVLSRIETPFKREDRNEVAAIAAANAPAQATTVPAAGAEVAPTAETQAGADTAQTGTPPAAPSARVVTVQPGNTLWAIARESYGEGPLFVRVFEANRDRIRDPDLIYPGQIFEIPE